MVKVSIIVPMFNVKPYIKQAIESLIKQSLKEIEIIIVNDGSTDGSRDIAADYAQQDSRIVIIDQPNGGYGKAMNNGLTHAKGDYIAILEPDDYVDLTMFEELYSKAIETGATIVRAEHTAFWDDEYANIYKTESSLSLFYLLYGKHEGWIDTRLIPHIYSHAPAIWTSIYLKTFIISYDITFVETPGASYQDLPFFIETMFKSQKFYAINKSYYHYRQSNPNSSVKANDKALFYIDYWNYLSQKLSSQNKEEWNRSKNQIAISFWNHVNWAWTVTKPSLRRPYIKGLYSGFKASNITLNDPMYRYLQKYGVTLYLIHRALQCGHPDIYRFLVFVKREFFNFIFMPIIAILYLIKKATILLINLIMNK